VKRAALLWSAPGGTLPYYAAGWEYRAFHHWAVQILPLDAKAVPQLFCR